VVCPYCKGDIEAEEPSLACHQCSAIHHDECWNSYGKCASCKYKRTGVAKTFSAFSLRVVRTWDKLVAAFIDVPLACLVITPRIMRDLFVESFLVSITLFFILQEIILVAKDVALTSFKGVLGSLQLWGER